MEIKKMKCFLCSEKISPQENYFKFIEIKKEKEVDTHYAHKICWHKFKHNLDNANMSLIKSNEMLRGLGNYMRSAGILPEEEVNIYGK